MKKILALAAVAALTAGVSAYAANPFSDVSTDHWAYQAVADLSAQGVVEGYPNGTFQGEKHITRYEVAQIVARLLAQESQLNAQQKATVEKLAAEYADELNNLGVRVSNLENKVGNVRWSGDARVKFERKVKTDTEAKKDTYDGRVRLNLAAQANPQVTVKAQLQAKTDFKASQNFGTLSVEKLHAEYAPVAGLTIDAGRTGATLGNGAFYDEDFNGVIASYDMGKFDVQAGYGRFVKADPGAGFKVKAADATKADVPGTFNFDKDGEAWFAQGHAKVTDKVTLGAFYTHFAKKDLKVDASEFAGVNANVQLTDALSLDGEYVRSLNLVKDADHKSALWTAGATYDFGMAQLGVHYYDVERGAYVGGTGAALDSIFENADGARYWVASAAVAVAKDVTLKAEYSFNAKSQKLVAQENDQAKDKDLQNVWNVSLNYAF